MTQKTFVRQFVVETLVRIDEGFKNRSSGLVDRCGGALDLARTLDIISYAESESAKQLVEAAAKRRFTRGDIDADRYDKSFGLYQDAFDMVWGH